MSAIVNDNLLSGDSVGKFFFDFVFYIRIIFGIETDYFVAIALYISKVLQIHPAVDIIVVVVNAEIIVKATDEYQPLNFNLILDEELTDKNWCYRVGKNRRILDD